MSFELPSLRLFKPLMLHVKHGSLIFCWSLSPFEKKPVETCRCVSKTGRDLVTFNRTERRRFHQSFHSESCESLQSSLKSLLSISLNMSYICHLPGTDRTRMPWNGCARTWAAVSQWPGGETFRAVAAANICLTHFAVTKHQHNAS